MSTFNSRPVQTAKTILAKYKEKGAAFLDEINGIFAFILYDAEQDAYLIGVTISA